VQSSSPAPSASSSTASSTGASGPRQSIGKVLTIVEENHSLQQIEAGMPYLRELARTFGYAVNYRGVSHPSLPNYLAMVGGSAFGVSDDASPTAHPLSGASVFGQAIRAGRTARLYAESMPQPCDATPSDPYAVKHAPWAYFVDERAACRNGMVPAGAPGSGAFARDIAAGRLPVVGMLIPNLDHDAHDGTLAAADVWLRQWMKPLLDGPDFTAGRLAIVVTTDDSASGNRVLTVVIAPGIRHRVVTTPLTHYSLARMYAEVSGTAPLRKARSARSLAAAFGLQLSA
jgi:acid phosphatase